MLTDLTVTDLGVIEQAEVEFETGSTALTGETGAGKTLVVAAMGLLLGYRADRSLVRAGARRAVVEGRWSLRDGHPLADKLIEHGLLDADPSEIEVLATRSIDASGGSRARINGHLVPAKLLDEICGSLVEITGQHLHQSITDSAWQRRLLDRLAGDEAQSLSGKVAAAVAEARQLDRQADELEASSRNRARDIDILQTEIAEISSSEIRPGEVVELRSSISRLENAEALALAVERATSSLTGEGGATLAALEAQRELSSVTAYDEDLSRLVERLESNRIELEDVAAELRKRVVVPDARALDQARDRLGLVARLARKYGESEEEILEYASDAARRLQELRTSESASSDLRAKAEGLWAEAREDARRLSEMRRVAGTKLARAAEGHLRDLAMPDARFEVSFTETDLYEGGLERPQFSVSANAGEPTQPFAKVASGGELSRIALALRLLAAEHGGTEDRCLIFDEVDAGVGGSAARSIGRCLAELGRRTGAQVVVVTHLPQVAAASDHHLKVNKVTKGSRTSAEVVPLDGEERVEEISRMLAGLPRSSRAQDHARELLEDPVV